MVEIWNSCRTSFRVMSGMARKMDSIILTSNASGLSIVTAGYIAGESSTSS